MSISYNDNAHLKINIEGHMELVMGVVYKKAAWWLDYRFQGRRYRKKVGPNKRIAEQAWAKVQTQIAENKFLDVQRVPKIRLKDFSIMYMDLHCQVNHSNMYKGAQSQINCLNRYFGDRYLHEIDTILVERFKRDRLREVKPATVNRGLAILKNMYNKAIAWGKFQGKNPVRGVRMLDEGSGRLRYLEKEEVSGLISHCKGLLRPIVILAVNTGMRKGEIFNLKWQDIDFGRKIIHLYKTKNKEKREVYINESVSNALIGVRKHPKSPYVFVRKNGEVVKDIRKPWEKALKASGIKDFRFHDLRHTFCSQLVMAGVDINTVRELAGHKTIHMTLRYSHLSQSHKQRAVDVLSQRLNLNAVVGQKKIQIGLDRAVRTPLETRS